MHDVLGPHLELVGVGQLAIDEQIRHLQEGGVLYKLNDIIATVTELTLAALDFANFGLGDGGVGVARVVQPMRVNYHQGLVSTCS